MPNTSELNPIIPGHLIELMANRCPDKKILIFERGDQGEDVLTYRNIYEQSNKMARMLLERGVGKGDVFVAYMKNYPEYIFSLIAASTLGAVMVPVDPRTRGDRFRFLCENSGAKGVIASSDCIDGINDVLGTIQSLNFVTVSGLSQKEGSGGKYESLSDVLNCTSWKVVEQQVCDLNAPMEIIYTSGTTGDPKGVVFTTGRVETFHALGKNVWRYTDQDILYSGLSLTHGNAQAVTLFPALQMGIPAVFSATFTKSRLWDICRKYGCTTFSLLGGMMSGIFNEPEKKDDADNPVRKVLSAGTPLSIWEPFEKRFGVNILEWYGAIEGGFACKQIGEGPIGSFGRPVQGMMEFRVVDEFDYDVATAVTGELVSRNSMGDTRVEYIGQPEASAKKTRGGWLRSGDMVHRDESGWFFFDYRKGEGIRRAGDFVQPDYIETFIGRHQDVSEVCVYGIPASSGAPGESDLVAAVAPFPGGIIDPVSLFQYCTQHLEKNFLPNFLQVVDEIPKTASQKHQPRILKAWLESNQGAIIDCSSIK